MPRPVRHTLTNKTMAVGVALLLHVLAGWGLTFLSFREEKQAEPEPARVLPVGLVLEEKSEDLQAVLHPFVKDSLPESPPALAISFLPAPFQNPAQGNASSKKNPAPSQPPWKVAGPGSGSGPDSTTSFFKVEARGERIVYVLDCSASMGLRGTWNIARRELLFSLQKLPPQARFQIILYHSRAFRLMAGPDWLEPTAEMLRQISLALAEKATEGKTEHGPALEKALALRPDVLFFLTDADDLTAEHLRLVARHHRPGTVIHTIELTTRNRGRPEMPLQALAELYGGKYQAVEILTSDLQ